MRAIDADALKEYITEACEDLAPLFNDNGKVARLVTENFCKDIDEQPTIQPEPHWIPVTERLPETSGEYLVTVKWVTGESDIDVYEYDARHKTWNDGESAGGERAVAWCNLPEPYKGVTE